MHGSFSHVLYSCPTFLMQPRMALLAALAQAKQGTIAIEQPSSSLIMRHPRCQWMLRRLGFWRQRFWMLFYGGRTPKRTSLWANKPSIWRFATRTLTKSDREAAAEASTGFRLVRQHLDKNNGKRFTGNKTELRQSASFACIDYSASAALLET